MKRNRIKLISTILISMLLIINMVACGKKDSVIVVGGKDYSEQYIMSQMMSILIEENTDLKTTVKDNFSGRVIFQTINSGDVDLYLEYAGSGLSNMKIDLDDEPDVLLEKLEKGFADRDIKWLESYGFSNTYSMVVNQEIAEKYDLETFSDLAAVGDELVIGTDYTFAERTDGYPGLIEAYDFEFKELKGMDASLMYQAVEQGDVDVISGYSTEGRIAMFDVVILEDNKNFFPPYDAAPVIRQEVLDEHPELEDVLNKLANRIDDEKMAELNARVDLDEEEPEDVARDFLVEEGLIGE